MSFDLEHIDWEKQSLPPLPKLLYKEHEIVTKQTKKQVEQFYLSNSVKVLNTKYETPKPIPSFETCLCFPKYMHNIFELLKFKEPTPIQSQAWPIIMQGHDMIGIAETGSGKTLAFVLPGLVHVKAHQQELKKMGLEEKRKGPIMLILTPTRELALQIEAECIRFADGVRIACVYGGKDRKEQIKKVKKGGM